MSTVRPVIAPAEARHHLIELADRVAAAQDVLDDARMARNLAILAYCDAGYEKATVARWAKVDRKVVHDVLARKWPSTP